MYSLSKTYTHKDSTFPNILGAFYCLRFQDANISKAVDLLSSLEPSGLRWLELHKTLDCKGGPHSAAFTQMAS